MTRSRRAVGLGRGDDELTSSPLAHARNTLLPALDETRQRESDALPPIPGRVELLPESNSTPT